MPKWASNWPTVALDVFYYVIVLGVVLSWIFPRVRNALFQQAIGSLVEAATDRTRQRSRELEDKAMERNRQARLLEERQKRVSDAVDKLTKALTDYASIVAEGFQGHYLAQATVDANLAVSVLQREGPGQAEMKTHLDMIRDALSNQTRLTLKFVNDRLDVINRLVREWLETTQAR